MWSLRAWSWRRELSPGAFEGSGVWGVGSRSRTLGRLRGEEDLVEREEASRALAAPEAK